MQNDALRQDEVGLVAGPLNSTLNSKALDTINAWRYHLPVILQIVDYH